MKTSRILPAKHTKGTKNKEIIDDEQKNTLAKFLFITQFLSFLPFFRLFRVFRRQNLRFVYVLQKLLIRGFNFEFFRAYICSTLPPKPDNSCACRQNSRNNCQRLRRNSVNRQTCKITRKTENRHFRAAIKRRNSSANIIGQTALEHCFLHRVFYADNDAGNKTENRQQPQTRHQSAD